MEVKIPKEIRDYTEAIFFGLSLRQLACSVLAVAVAVGIYFGLKDVVGTEAVSWLCILGAAPFAALGFIRYHGMAAGQFALAWLLSEVLLPKTLVFKAENRYAIQITKGETTYAFLSKVVAAGQRAFRRAARRTAGHSDPTNLA